MIRLILKNKKHQVILEGDDSYEWRCIGDQLEAENLGWA